MHPPRRKDDWNSHWDAYAESASLNPAQAYRRALIRAALELERAPRPLRLLEIGCGQGDLSRELVERHPDLELVGIDLSDTGVELARSKVKRGVFFRQDLSQPLAVPARYHGWATHAVCSEVLEHVDDAALALENARTLLAPGARLVVTVPAGPLSAFDRHIGHRRHFTVDSLSDVLGRAGLEVESVRGAGFPFFNLYRLLVVLRGKRLVTDAAGERLPASARALMHAFSRLFRFNADRGELGWQLVGVGVKPMR